jgi:hypothetical protein
LNILTKGVPPLEGVAQLPQGNRQYAISLQLAANSQKLTPNFLHPLTIIPLALCNFAGL